VHLSETEFKELQKGGNVPLQNLLPLIFWEMGLQLQKRIYPQEELTEEQLEEKRKQEQKDKKKKKQHDANEEPPVEDIPLKDIVVVPGQEISGYIFVDFPQTEQHINELKEAGVVFDKILSLSDAIAEGEEEVVPGAIIA